MFVTEEQGGERKEEGSLHPFAPGLRIRRLLVALPHYEPHERYGHFHDEQIVGNQGLPTAPWSRQLGTEPHNILRPLS